MISGFTRQETIALTGLKSGKLSYYDQIGWIVPQKYGEPTRPKVFYSHEQILQLKIIQSFKGRLTLNQLREAVQLFEERGFEVSAFTCQLAWINDELHLIESWEAFGQLVFNISNDFREVVQVRSVGMIGALLMDLRESARENNIADYEKRVKGTVLESVIARKD